MNYPTFIICRDRVSCLTQLVSWLEGVGQERIYLVDNDSSYPPLLEYYETTPHTVIHMGWNSGHVGVWNHGILSEHVKDDEYFIVSDPDVVPVEQCPADAIDYFRSRLDKYQDRTKCGFGLKIDDLPDHYALKERVVSYESQFNRWYAPEHNLRFAPIDTTFALYRPRASQDVSLSIRTLEPYVARHLAWYENTNDLGEEETFYRKHLNPHVSSWNKEEGPHWA